MVKKHPVSYEHKENKRNCKHFSDIGFIITKNAKLKYPKSLHLIRKLYNFFKPICLKVYEDVDIL